MTAAPWRLLGRGEADGPAGAALQGQAGPVRFADPAAWAVALAVREALAGSALPTDGGTAAIGLVTVSPDGPREVLRQVGQAASAGSMSALRFPAANPGTLAGLACIVCRLNGPSLNLTMVPEDGLPVAWAQLRGWLGDARIRAGVLAACAYGAEAPRARAVVIGSGAPEPGLDLAPALAWLADLPGARELPDAP